MKQALINGKIYIEKGTFEEAVLIDEDKILKTGSNGEILASAGADCKVYYCSGKTVLPGLNDSHLHLLQVGMMLNMAPIDKSRSIEHMIEICKTYMKENPERVKNLYTLWDGIRNCLQKVRNVCPPDTTSIISALKFRLFWKEYVVMPSV